MYESHTCESLFMTGSQKLYIYLISMLWLSGKLTQGFIIEHGIKERCFLSFSYDADDRGSRVELWIVKQEEY